MNNPADYSSSQYSSSQYSSSQPDRLAGRPPSPDSMIKKSKNWSMPKSSWAWLESQPNQAQAIRDAIAFYISYLDATSDDYPEYYEQVEYPCDELIN